ncbi:ABC transporter permease [Mucilaginibacter sp. UR6-1]|uniref:ABC transporter permease/M1 family aminopeptidase n=1 Tax=Mucilaginibacter sp. UR6-1 TaxID=1435643 RepID=UPI001E597282|nr:M1 family aminopeptidase [Mucilaginibacter sp. UR6-1]MCC8407831.1 ABC transporter permease [Mucilaginibacter sp. UR6-1]
MTSLLKFELGTYFKKPGIYIALILLFAAGFFIGLKMSFSPGNDIYRNAPYSIANMIGLLSLTCIFITTILAAQILFKEHDSRFAILLYTTPITKARYLLSRFYTLFILAAACFILLVAGYLTGHIADSDRAEYRDFNIWFYVQPVLVVAIPNLLLCSALVSTVAWLAPNKLIVYITGLFVYISYLIMLTYSGSPMMAGSLPQSPEALELSAKVDPFGLSAFYQQTNLWTVAQKNTSVIHLTGNILFNRLIYIVLPLLLLSVVYLKFRFSIRDNGYAKNKLIHTEAESPIRNYHVSTVFAHGAKYTLVVLTSLIQHNIKIIVKSIPFVLISLGLIFYMSMEFYGTIDQGIRLPEQYASTGLLVNRVIYNLPGLLLPVILFYGHELYWRSSTYRFNLIENSTPVVNIIFLLSKWLSLTVMIILLTGIIITTGIAFQFIYHYTQISWQVYATAYFFIDLPLIICAALSLIIQHLINRKWIGLIVTCIILFLLATSIGKAIGITHPLLRFAAAYTARYSEMNGWDAYSGSFMWRILYGTAFITLAWMMANYGLKKLTKKKLCLLGIPFCLCMLTGVYIYRQATPLSPQQQLDNRQSYEQLYRKFININQPVITRVITKIDLYPEDNAYKVWGKYSLKNNGASPVKKLLVNFDDDLKIRMVTYQAGGKQHILDTKTGLIPLKQPLMPGDSATFTFSFFYEWNGFTGHQPFNAIVHNGTFMRISNYFPRFGYQTDKEISLPGERRKRHLGAITPLTSIDAPRGSSDFIDLDMTVSVPYGQFVVGVGNLAKQWQSNKRSYFKYLSGTPIPFRFGLSSAFYKIKKLKYKGVEFEVYYDSRHFENVSHLIKNATRTMDYCRTNFGPYPYKIIRFAEVSSFTDGFAGTAYPATIFMTEHLLFHNNLNTDRGQDVINELAAHELSHQWWGNGRLAPDEREGSKLLTETLAMYTELMLAKQYLGVQAVKEKAAIHESIYLNERGFTKEPPLFKARPEDTHLYYDKGLIVMYKLSKLLGEEKINKALKNLLQKHAYTNPPPVATDLLTELYQVSDAVQKARIRELFSH